MKADFFPEVPVIFNVDGAVKKHYHIPLLVSLMVIQPIVAIKR